MNQTPPEAHEPLPAGPLAVLIVGAGFSGLAMAIRCRQAGIGPLLIVDKADGIGGTWHANTYPGAACDIPSHLYSLSFVPKPDWTRLYPEQAEIAAYLRETAEAQGLTPHIRLGVAVTAARWDADAGLWQVETSRGRLSARALVSGMGGLHHPILPAIPGVGSFAGASFHSTAWDHACDLAGRRVGVIGTGASAVQFVPRIAPEVAHLTLFQRTPPWILPRRDRAISARETSRFQRIPFARRLFRQRLFWLHELRALLGFTRVSKATAQAEGMARRHLARAVRDPNLRAKLTPDYRLGCKRVLVSDDFYPALARANVSLETARIERIVPEGVVTNDGRTHALDVLVYGTGFDVAGSFRRVPVTGRDGRTLAEAWADGMATNQGISVAGFPNFFLLMGPNTGLGHNSMILMIEVQVAHVLACLKALGKAGDGIIEVTPEAQARFGADVAARSATSIWSQGGCRSWYLDVRGRNAALWPGSYLSYRRSARRPGRGDYRLS